MQTAASIRRPLQAVLGILLSLLVPQELRATSETTFQLKGLSEKAQIVVDKWGIPHIYAESMEDLFFVQGFNAARDRLWQLDLWRRQGEGKLAEAFGARFVAQDRAARLFRYRGDLNKEFRSYHPKGKEILTAFTSGINAYVDLTRSRPELLPPEFKLTRSAPGYWSPTTPLSRIFALTRNLGREVALAQLVRLMGPEAVEKVSMFQPATKLEVPSGLDLSLIDDGVLKDYSLARSGVAFKPSDFASRLRASERTRYAQLLSVPAIAENTSRPMYESNNWVLSGEMTESGMPILAGDPHRAQSVPSLRYIAHLVGPGWNVIGAGEPALPGLSLGHNERIAYSLTIFAFADEEDLYVYDTNPEDPSQYRYRGGWEQMREVKETIPVKGGGAETVTLKFTRHGPVLSEDLSHHKAYALRAAYLEHEGTAAYLASLRLDQAQNWKQFTEGMEKHYTPSENMAYADVDGNIGWFGCSIAPVRPNWNGLLPVPGNGDYEWQGFLDTRKLPRILNPAEGFFASANQYNIPPGYPSTGISAHEWAEPYRFNRVVESIKGQKNLTLADATKLQYDELSLPARELVPLLDRLASEKPDLAAALTLLRRWDYVLSRDSVAASLFELWASQLHKNVFALYVPPAARALFGSGNRAVLLRLIKAPDRAFGPNPEAGRDAVLLQSLEQAVAFLKGKLGPEMNSWQWGRLHHMTYTHDLSATSDPETRKKLDIGPLPQGGDGFTVHNTGYRASDFNQNSGASYREVIDLSDWDKSLTLNSPGQSGDPASRHYRDLFPLWAEGKFVPMLFSRDAVMDAAEHVFVLEPADEEGEDDDTE
jgi:penicillin amidase